MNHYNIDIRQKTGKLMVFLFEGDKAKPVKGATVTITGNNQNITLQTNESGQTQSVTLPVNDPYTEYSANVTADGYNLVKLHGIKVFPNTSGIQEIQLTPVRQGNYRATEEHTISPQKIEVPDQKGAPINPANIPEPTSSPIYSHPAGRPNGPPVGLLIPEYIIVHCGAPNESAKKHRVKYTDYLAKVASGEIFSNWNKEALIANILCINSYALNKIFTQYYDGRFDVTCSIQYDQKYDPLQTTSKEIIEVVDNVFNQYIKHPDPQLKQPFFAEFRANPRRRCVFGQNGSQLLAIQGKKHLDIIKHYFEGCFRPMEVISTAGVIFQGRPTAPPTKVLKEGSSGPDVKEIQGYLIEISKKYPKIPRLQLDSKFKQTTKKAVQTFQEIFFLPKTGEVDFRTWYKIANLYFSILEYRNSQES